MSETATPDDALAPGAYLLPRSNAGHVLLRHTLPAALDLSLVPEAPADAPLQSVYHFTIGVPVTDARIATEPPYAHLLPDREGDDHG